MYKLYVYRVINSIPCWILMEEFEQLETAAHYLHGCYFLNAKCIDKNGKEYHLSEHENCDEDGNEYVDFSFTPL